MGRQVEATINRAFVYTLAFVLNVTDPLRDLRPDAYLTCLMVRPPVAGGDET